MERIEALNRKIRDNAGRRPRGCRRLPTDAAAGPTNSKYGDQKRRVTVERLDAAARYDLEELEEWVAGARTCLREASEKAPTQQAGSSGKEKARPEGADLSP